MSEVEVKKPLKRSAGDADAESDVKKQKTETEEETEETEEAVGKAPGAPFTNMV